MKNLKAVYLSLFIVSAVVICFEIISTRISSVIFVSNYAFIIISLAILGLGLGGVYSHYRIRENDAGRLMRLIARTIIFVAASLILFIVIVILTGISSPYIYFFFLFIPFFFSGIVYSQIFKLFAEQSFKLYAADLAGAAAGSAVSIFLLNSINAPNAVIFLSFVSLGSASYLLYSSGELTKKKNIIFSSAVLAGLVLIVLFGKADILGKVNIGKFPEKDFYYAYPDAESISNISESRWSIFGRTDLVSYINQDYVKNLFIDGAAGTSMYRFNGNPKAPGRLLYSMLASNSTFIPFTFLKDYQKNNMLAIGPGGGKEVLTGLITGVSEITGVEINPDFVELVKEYRDFNGGIYNDFPNVEILVKEGRHFVKHTGKSYDLIVMALPSTEQLQNIDNLASSENYLLTVEAIRDYLNILTDEGEMIFTVHNRWELMRLVITACYAFEEVGISKEEALNHFILLAGNFPPTIVIKKNAFTHGEIAYAQNVMKDIPKDLPSATYLPYNLSSSPNTIENRLLRAIAGNQMPLEKYIEQNEFDISPVYDDSPYFYKITKNTPSDYLWLLAGVFLFSIAVVFIPYSRLKRKLLKKRVNGILAPLSIFACIGLGFMILEVSLFQKLILYLGTPTISLAVLLGSLLIGMGLGSYFGNKMLNNDLVKRIRIISLAIIIYGTILFIAAPFVLNELLEYSQVIRSVVVILFIIPFGFVLGIPFPTAIQILRQVKLEECIPWMYGVNGIMSVLGSISAVIISMSFGFTPAFFFGLFMYAVVLGSTFAFSK